MIEELRERLGSDATKAIRVRIFEIVGIALIGTYIFFFGLGESLSWIYALVILSILIGGQLIDYIKKKIKYKEKAKGTQFDRVTNILIVIMSLYAVAMFVYHKIGHLL